MSAFLCHHFAEVTDYSFTADMENEVSQIVIEVFLSATAYCHIWDHNHTLSVFCLNCSSSLLVYWVWLTFTEVIYYSSTEFLITTLLLWEISNFNKCSTWKTISTFFLQLDNVSAGLTDWKGLLRDYWTRFSSYCERANNVHIHQVIYLFV